MVVHTAVGHVLPQSDCDLAQAMPGQSIIQATGSESHLHSAQHPLPARPPDPKYSREEGPAALRHKPHGGAANQTAPQQQLSDDDDGPPPLVDDEGVEPPKSKGRKPPEASRDDGDGEEDMPDLVSDNEDPNKQHRGRAMPDPAAARESAAAPGKAEKASKKAAEGKSKADKEVRIWVGPTSGTLREHCF